MWSVSVGVVYQVLPCQKTIFCHSKLFQVGVHIQWNHECPSKALICDVATKYKEYAKHWDSQIHRTQEPITTLTEHHALFGQIQAYLQELICVWMCFSAPKCSIIIAHIIFGCSAWNLVSFIMRLCVPPTQ
jgi:hypothetical protein